MPSKAARMLATMVSMSEYPRRGCAASALRNGVSVRPEVALEERIVLVLPRKRVQGAETVTYAVML